MICMNGVSSALTSCGLLINLDTFVSVVQLFWLMVLALKLIVELISENKFITKP